MGSEPFLNDKKAYPSIKLKEFLTKMFILFLKRNPIQNKKKNFMLVSQGNAGDEVVGEAQRI